MVRTLQPSGEIGYWQAEFDRGTLTIAGDAAGRLGVPAFQPMPFDRLSSLWGMGEAIDFAQWLASDPAPTLQLESYDRDPAAFTFLKQPDCSAGTNAPHGTVQLAAVSPEDRDAANSALGSLAPQILASLPDPVFVHETGHGWVFVNDAAVPLLTDDPYSVDGRLDFAMPKGFRRMMHHMLERVEASGKASRIEFYAKHRLLGLKWWSGLWSPLFAPDGRLNGVFILHRDVSEQTEMQGQLLRERKKLHRLATTDSLTKMSNRRNFLAAFESTVAAEAKHGRPVAVVLFDIDHFKAVNDTYGHAAGDAVLKAVADVTRDQLRVHDLVARWGGEEFIICLPGSDLLEACTIAERLREAIEALVVPSNGQMLRVTASFGVKVQQAKAIVSSTERDALFAVADAALYEAKRQGRNRLVTAELTEQ